MFIVSGWARHAFIVLGDESRRASAGGRALRAAGRLIGWMAGLLIVWLHGKALRQCFLSMLSRLQARN